MRFNSFGRALCSASALSLLATGALGAAHAQIVSGDVRLDNGERSFAGVTVAIPELGVETTTGQDGRFRFNGIAPGTYDMVVTYLGETLETRQVTVTEEGARLSIAFDERVMDTVIVTGRRGAIQSAAALERASDELKSIVTADDIGQFGDPTVAESLQRIPGLSINRSRGEGQQASIRGLPTEFATVTVDGARLGTSDPDINSTNLDFFSADNLSQIEVIKTLTPEQDADAIAGSIDLKTISALALGRNSYGGRVEYGYQDKAESWNPKVSGDFTRIFETANGRLGIAGGITWQDRETITDEASIGDGLNFFTREEYEDDGELVQEFFQDGDVDDCSDDQEGGTILECYIIPAELDLRSEEQERERLSLNGQVEWETTNHLFQLRGTYSKSEQDRYTNRVTFDFSRSDGDVPTGLGTDDPDVDEVVSIGVDEDGDLFGVFEDGRSERRLQPRFEEEEVYTIGMEGTSDFGDNWTLNYGADFSSNEKDVERSEARFRSDNIVLDFSNLGADGIDLSLGQEIFDVDDDDPDPNTPEGWPLRTTSVDGEDFGTPNERFETSTDEFETYYANAERRFTLFNREAAFKFGAKHRKRDRLFDFSRIEYLTDPDVSLADFNPRPRADRSDLFIPFDVERGDVESVLGDLIANGRVATPQERGDFIVTANLQDDYVSEEETNAGYFQLTFEPYDRFQVIAGVRVEQTDFSSTGSAVRFVSFDDGSSEALEAALENGGVDGDAIDAFLDPRFDGIIDIEPFTGGNDYTEVFPSVNLRWEPTDTTVVRASYTEGLKRPEFREVAAISQLRTEEQVDDDVLCAVITGTDDECPSDLDNFTGVLTSIEAAEAALAQATAESTGGEPFRTEADQIRNPFLDPLTSQNWDASIAWYPDENTVLSVAVFYKEIDNFIVPFATSDEAQIAALGFAPDDFTVNSLGVSDIDTTFINGDTAEITGLELSYYQAYTFLPGLLSGLYFQGNATFADSEASADLVGRDFKFPDQSDLIGNLSLGWENEALSVRASMAYQGERLRAINEAGLDDGDDPSGDVVEDERTQWDINVRYNVNDAVQVYFDAININDAEDNRSFRGGNTQTLNSGDFFETRENYGPTYQFGLRFKF